MLSWTLHSILSFPFLLFKTIFIPWHACWSISGLCENAQQSPAIIFLIVQRSPSVSAGIITASYILLGASTANWCYSVPSCSTHPFASWALQGQTWILLLQDWHGPSPKVAIPLLFGVASSSSIFQLLFWPFIQLIGASPGVSRSWGYRSHLRTRKKPSHGDIHFSTSFTSLSNVGFIAGF